MNIIDHLYERQIVAITLSKDKQSVEFMEACDHYYKESLSKDAISTLISELTDIHSQMSGTKWVEIKPTDIMPDLSKIERVIDSLDGAH
jgi:hypothetical protein